jgi:hypothetical protein
VEAENQGCLNVGHGLWVLSSLGIQPTGDIMEKNAARITSLVSVNMGHWPLFDPWMTCFFPSFLDEAILDEGLNIEQLKTGWWFGAFFVFPYIENFIIPTDEVIFFRGVFQPPTRTSPKSVVQNHRFSPMNFGRPELGGSPRSSGGEAKFGWDQLRARGTQFSQDWSSPKNGM